MTVTTHTLEFDFLTNQSVSLNKVAHNIRVYFALDVALVKILQLHFMCP